MSWWWFFNFWVATGCAGFLLGYASKRWGWW